MSDSLHIAFGNLLEAWRRKSPNRAWGGWWALSGFSYQAAVYLQRFFTSLVDRSAEAGVLAEIETLSDITCPEYGGFLLIQAKRTLTNEALRNALREAYLITELCLEQYPELLPALRFQIACRYRKTGKNPSDLRGEDVIADGLNTDTWDAMIGCLHEIEPVIETPDPLDQLHAFLWHHGIRDTASFIDDCLGVLLRFFGETSPEGQRDLGRELARLYWRACPPDSPTMPGTLATKTDVQPDPKAGDANLVLTGQRPRLSDLRMGCFRDRSHILKPLWRSFSKWHEQLLSRDISSSRSVPVFWIDGRSGDGKSVLLLQLVSEALHKELGTPMYILDSGSSLPVLIRQAPDFRHHNSRFILLVVDDLFDVRNRDQWEEEIDEVLFKGTPPFAILTCGPTDQRELLQHRLPDAFDVSNFSVPHLATPEIQEFRKWFNRRTGKRRRLANLTTDNVLVVQLLFELASGTRLQSFARRFRDRLEHSGVFELVRTILSVNALYLDSPMPPVPDHRRDVLLRLCEQDQLHFEFKQVSEELPFGSIRLAHAHLAWKLLSEWASPPSTLAEQWGRELAKAIEWVQDQARSAFTFDLLLGVLSTSHLATRTVTLGSHSPSTRVSAIESMYRCHVNIHGGSCPVNTLYPWLALSKRLLPARLIPSPVTSATQLVLEGEGCENLSPIAAAYVWLDTDSQSGERADASRDAIERLLLSGGNQRGLAHALNMIFTYTKKKERARKMLLSWLRNYPGHRDATVVLRPLRKKEKWDSEVQETCLIWLKANPDHNEAPSVLASMVNGYPGSKEIQQVASSWLRNNMDHPRVSDLICTAIRQWPHLDEFAKAGRRFLEVRQDVHDMSGILVNLINSSRHMKQIVKRGTANSWLRQYGQERAAGPVIAAAVKRWPGDDDLRSIGWKYVEKFLRDRDITSVIYSLMKTRRHDPLTVTTVFNLLDSGLSKAARVDVLVTVIGLWPEDPRTVGLVTKCIEDPTIKSRSGRLLARLLKARPDDTDLLKLAEQCLGLQSPKAQHDLLLTAVKVHPQSTSIHAAVRKALRKNVRAAWYPNLLQRALMSWPNDKDFTDSARAWLLENRSNYNYVTILSGLMSADMYSKECRAMAMEFVRTEGTKCHPSRLTELLAASHADPHLVSPILDCISKFPTQHVRRYALQSVSNTLIWNLHNALRCVCEQVEKKKWAICMRIAYGAASFPEQLPNLEEIMSSDLCSDDSSILLRCLLQVGRMSEEVDRMLVKWMSDNYRRPGYSRILAALRSAPKQWAHLQKGMGLPPTVVLDFVSRHKPRK